MDFNKLNQKIESNNLVLKPISETDRVFINGMFNDPDIKRYYIVPKEAQQDYRKLIDYWHNDVRNRAGNCWLIYQKGSGSFSKDKQVGFIAFEFRDTLKNASVSYAVLPEYRRNGIATTSIQIIIDQLKNEGVESIEADIDRDNLGSEKVVEKLGFTANKKQALVDPEMMRDGEIRMRALWKKRLVEFSENKITGRIPLSATIDQITPEINQLQEEINSKGQHPTLLVRYFYLLGRIKFLERNYEEAQKSFGSCNMITMQQGLPEIHETFYWFARMKEAKGESPENIKMYYGFALEKYNDNPNYISKAEIEKEMNK
jgi:RimJ/RimL family protein N-acetyltransferase